MKHVPVLSVISCGLSVNVSQKSQISVCERGICRCVSPSGKTIVTTLCSM